MTTEEFRETIMKSLEEMTNKKLNSLCLTDEIIEGIVEGNYPISQKSYILGHLSSCIQCCDAVGIYSKLRRGER